MAFSCTFVLGPGLAGLVVAAAGGASALLIDAASFLLCAGLLVDLSPRVEEAEQATVRTRLQAAWGHIGEAPPLARLLLAEAIALIFFAADASIEVPYAKTTLNVGDRGYGLILTVWGIGAGLGSLAFARAMRRPLGAMLSGGALAVGLAYLGFAAAPSLAFACAASLVGGLGNGVQWASMLSAVQQLTPPSLQGQIMGVVEAIGAFFPGLGLLLGGALVAIGSPRSAFLVVGVGAALMTVAFVRISADSGLEPAQPGAVAASGGESGGSTGAASRCTATRSLDCTLRTTPDRSLSTTGPGHAGAHAHETTLLDHRGPAAAGRGRNHRAHLAATGMASGQPGGTASGPGTRGRAAGVRDPRAAPLRLAGRPRPGDEPPGSSPGGGLRNRGDGPELGRQAPAGVAVAEQPRGVLGVPPDRRADRQGGDRRRPQPAQRTGDPERHLRPGRLRGLHDHERDQLRGDRLRAAGDQGSWPDPPDAGVVPAHAAGPGGPRAR